MSSSRAQVENTADDLISEFDPGTYATEVKSYLEYREEDQGTESQPPVNPYWAFAKRLVDLENLIFPITTQKLLFWCVYASIVIGLWQAQSRTGEPDATMKKITGADILATSLVMNIAEPAILILALLFGKFPGNLVKPELVLKKPKEDVELDLEAQLPKQNDKGKAHAEPEMGLRERIKHKDKIPPLLSIRKIHKNNEHIAIIIAAHNSSKIFMQTLRSSLNVVNPDQVIVLDNGSKPEEELATREILKKLGVIFMQRKAGNKSFAVTAAAIIAQDRGHKNILIIDHDVDVPENFVMELEKFSESVKAINYPITAACNDSNTSWFTKTLRDLQSLEYYGAATINGLLDRMLAVYFPHGAVGAYETDTFIKTMKNHPGVFYGEDVRTGVLLWNLLFKMGLGSYIFPTLAPETLVELYYQRVKSWGFGIYLVLPSILKNFITSWKLPLDFLITRKATELYVFYSAAVELVWLPLFIYCVLKPSYWITAGAAIGGKYITTLLWHYLKLNEELRKPLLTVLLYPLYQFVIKFMTLLSLIRMFALFLPNQVSMPEIAKLIKNGHFDDVFAFIGKPRDQEEPFLFMAKVPTLSKNRFMRLFGNSTVVTVPVRQSNANEVVSMLKQAEMDFMKLHGELVTLAKAVGITGVIAFVAQIIASIILNQVYHQPPTNRETYTVTLEFAIAMTIGVTAALVYLIGKASIEPLYKNKVANIQRHRFGLWNLAENPNVAMLEGQVKVLEEQETPRKSAA